MQRSKCIQYYKLAQEFAQIFSKDPSSKVGAIILADNSYQILSMGYNGMPRKIREHDPSRWERPIKYSLVEHAERNALYNACRHGTPLEGSIAVITLFPCVDCARGLIQSGIKLIISYKDPERESRWGKDWMLAESLFDEAGVSVLLLNDTEIQRECGPVNLSSTTSQECRRDSYPSKHFGEILSRNQEYCPPECIAWYLI